LSEGGAPCFDGIGHSSLTKFSKTDGTVVEKHASELMDDGYD